MCGADGVTYDNDCIRQVRSVYMYIRVSSCVCADGVTYDNDCIRQVRSVYMYIRVSSCVWC